MLKCLNPSCGREFLYAANKVRNYDVTVEEVESLETRVCPFCHSLETENLGPVDVIDSDPEGDLVTMDACCLRCGFRFCFDDFVPRPEKETIP